MESGRPRPVCLAKGATPASQPEGNTPSYCLRFRVLPKTRSILWVRFYG